MLEGSGVEVVENDLLDLLLYFLGLAQNNVTLALDSRLLELGVLKDIGENVDTLGNIGVEGLGEVDSVFALVGCQTSMPICRSVMEGKRTDVYALR